MRLPVYQPPDAGVLWRVAQFGRQTTPAGRVYWWDNAGRASQRLLIIQATLAGSIVYRDPAGEQPVGPGSFLLFTHGEPSAYGQPGPLRKPYACAWIGLVGAGVAEHADAFRKRHGSVVEAGVGHPLFAEFDDLIRSAEPASATPPHRLAADAFRFLMRLFEHAERDRLRELTPVDQAIEHLLRQPHLPLSVDQVARHFGCSREHLSRLFHTRVGQPAAAYLADARRRRALRLLRETDLPLAAVADQCGYATTHTLARQVRAATGLSPSQVRARRHTARTTPA